MNGVSDDEEEEKDEEEESDDDHIVAKGRTKTVDAEGEENADTKEVEAKKKEVCFSYFKAANYEIQSMTILQKNTYQAYLERKKAKKAEKREQMRALREKEREALKDVEHQAKAKQKVAVQASLLFLRV